jgi:hypothetical protein
MKRILKDPEPEDKVDGRSFNIRSRKKMEREVRRLTYTSARADKTKGIRSKKGKKFGLYTAEDMGIDEDESKEEAAQPPSTEDTKSKPTDVADQADLGIVNEKRELVAAQHEETN